MKKILEFLQRRVRGQPSQCNKAEAKHTINSLPDTWELPLKGFRENNLESGQIEFLGDDDLSRLNSLLPWKCFTTDSRGQRFGNPAWKGKRNSPQVIPDKRIVWLDSLFNLSDKSVLEFGCFEGIHTIALAQRAAKVYAIDSRIENVVKTIVRANLLGFSPAVSVCDLEQEKDVERLPVVDVVHHVGVLYHLKNPVNHLIKVGALARQGILLDTHYATNDMAKSTSVVGQHAYRYCHYQEKGRDEVFSGMYDHAKWLLLDDIKKILRDIGFSDICVYKDEQQRNGPRVTLSAARPCVGELFF
ncbi:MAG: methyltransferase domain-containing protein [Nitrospirales bacterium]